MAGPKRGVKRFASTLDDSAKRKLRKLAESALISEESRIAHSLPWQQMNYPIPSGAPSGLYNLSTSSKEYKFVDVSFGTTNAASPVLSAAASTFYLLNGLQLGTSAYQRIGNKIAMKSCYWSLTFGINAVNTIATSTSGTPQVPVRMMIVYDKQTNGALPVVSDLLSGYSGIANSTARAIDVNSPNNLNNKDRFIVLCDKRFVLSAQGTGSRILKKYKKLSTSVSYKSGATVGNVTDITSGGLYFIAYRDDDLGNNSNPDTSVRMTGDIRLRYQDD